MTVRPRILVADDDLVLCTLLQEVLQDAGYAVQVVHDGDQLIRSAQEQAPDLVLVDLMMPLMDGFEAIRQLRNDTRTSHLPMIILTALSESNEVVTGFDSGADDYIVKPYNIDILLARIRGHLRRAAKLPVRNPLTGLPGNGLLQAELRHLLSQEQALFLLYVDLDNFKVFNDAYGFARGDRAIHMLAHTLTDIVPRGEFVGHIGGDDFAVIYTGSDVEALCQRIIAAFDARVPELYDVADRQRGYFEGIDRHGVARRFGLLSLSIAVVGTEWREFQDVDAIGRVAAELKLRAKQTAGSCYIFDRRRTVPADHDPERRDRDNPAALIIANHVDIHHACETALTRHGYRPFFADTLVAANSLLLREPHPALLVADETFEPAVWQFWRRLTPPPLLVLLTADQKRRAAAEADGATLVLPVTDVARLTTALTSLLERIAPLQSVPDLSSDSSVE